MRRVVLVGVIGLFFSACTEVAKVAPLAKKDTIKNSEVTERNVTLSSKKNSEKEDVHVLENIFDDELYFELDKVSKRRKVNVVINHLDAYPWEKKELKKAYKKHSKLWSKKQSSDFKKILEEDSYLALCSDVRYWENLEFEESEPQRDVLQSLLLIRYLHNLAHGCPKWVESKVKGENSKKFMHTKHILSLLPHEVIIGKLMKILAPKEREFLKMVKQYHNKKSDELRLKIENMKHNALHPNYRVKEN